MQNSALDKNSNSERSVDSGVSGALPSLTHILSMIIYLCLLFCLLVMDVVFMKLSADNESD